ncbi:MAG TPA: glycerol-3-phosphate 1-O-acyltransferase PlsB [Burkholderiaceae bacterium]|nr:glycerol-3-phosphate 1-O-acyltransferase PlsB [Burkholderiaceae bacterium]
MSVRDLLPLVLRRLLRVFVRFSVVPAEGLPEGVDRGRPIVYALHIRQLSTLLLLDEVTERQGLPRPRVPLIAGSLKEQGAFFFLPRHGQPSPLTRSPYRYSERLQRLVAVAQQDPSIDVQIVPVSVFWGRAPQKQPSILKALFADAWAVPGFVGQVLRILIHGRQTLLVFGRPLSLRAEVDAAGREHAAPDAALRRLGRRLRAAFRHERELVIGPNLSHRETLLHAVIDAEPVRAAIRDEAIARGTTADKVELRARRIAIGIASHYSYPFIRAFDIALTALWNRLYEGVAVHHFESIAPVAAGAELVYLPCHRSHVDYLLLSYVIYHRGLQTPHVAAGDNLNLPLVGSLLRRGGAFFLRRSFKGDALYGAVFAEYLHAMLSRGFPIEYFIEGGRSRTGLMLTPKAGMLTMTVESLLRDPARPLVFVPVYIGYERLVEGDTYIAELSGRPKERESVLGLMRSLRALRERFGKVHVNVGEPLRCDAGALADEATRYRRIGELATELATRINDAVVISPVNLLALAMLAAPRPAMDAQRLAEQIDMIRALLERVPYSGRLVLTPLDGRGVVAYAEQQRIVQRVRHPLGDVVQAEPRQAILLAYFRNNVLHALAVPALLATLIARNGRITGSHAAAVTGRLFPILKAGLFLSGDEAELPSRVSRLIAAFVELGLAQRADEDAPGGTPFDSPFETPFDALGATLCAPALPQSQRGSLSLHGLAGMLRAPLERFYIAVTTLAQAAPGSLDGQALEERCVLFAQRVVMLHESAGPEFADRAAFRSIITTLRELGQIEEIDGRLHPTPLLAASVADAPWLLSADTRLALSHLTETQG